MKADTKIYSDFIKYKNVEICNKSNTFCLGTNCHIIYKTSQGWFVDVDNGPYLTKKSAIYFTLKGF